MKRMLLLIICTLNGVISAQPYRLDTLEQIGAYVNEMPHSPAPDGGDWYNPSFAQFYQQQEPSVFSQLGRMLGIVSPRWDVREFYDALTRLTQKRKDMTFSDDHSGEPYQEITVPENTQWVIWGDLHGALHSLYHGLRELQYQEKIDNELRIQDDNLYLCFIGDLIDRSPYSLEVLTIVFHLMDRNPDRVIYIRGNHETDGYWTNFATRASLKHKAMHLSDQDIPFERELNAFFATLPRVVYLSVDGRPDEYMHISHQGRTYHNARLGHEDITYIQRISASVRGEARYETLSQAHGLNLIGFHYGAAEWSLLSCPVWIYQQFFNFTYDAFSLLHIPESIDSAAISLYRRDIDSADSRFHRLRTFDVTSGQEVKPSQKHGVSEALSSFWIGSSIAISRGLGMQGTSLERGIMQSIQEANNTGGVQENLIRPMIFDDAYMPHRALQNATYLIDDFDIGIIVAPTGTPTVQAYSQKVKDAGGAILFPVTGAPALRTPEMTHMIHLRPSYPDEAVAATNYVMETYKTRRMAFLYQDDAFGRPLRDAAIRTLQERGIDDWIAVPYVLGQVDFSRQAQEIREFNPSAIGFFATVSASKEVLRELDAAFLRGRPLFGNSDLGIYGFRQFMAEQGLSCIIPLAVPDPEKSDLPIAQQFRQHMDMINWPYDVFAFEGYLAAQLFVHGLRQIDQPISINKLLSWFTSLQEYQFNGLELTYNPETRDLSQEVSITTVGVEYG